MTPKWGFGVAVLPVGALCFYHAHFGRTCFQNGHFGRISSTLYFTVFRSLGGHASARRVAQAVLPSGALFRAGDFTLHPCAPKSHMCPLPHLGLSNLDSSVHGLRVTVCKWCGLLQDLFWITAGADTFYQRTGRKHRGQEPTAKSVSYVKISSTFKAI